MEFLGNLLEVQSSSVSLSVEREAPASLGLFELKHIITVLAIYATAPTLALGLCRAKLLCAREPSKRRDSWPPRSQDL